MNSADKRRRVPLSHCASLCSPGLLVVAVVVGAAAAGTAHRQAAVGKANSGRASFVGSRRSVELADGKNSPLILEKERAEL